MKHYRILGRYRGQVEEIDHANSRKEAEYLVYEYQLAFGENWLVWAEKQNINDSRLLGDCG